MLEQGLAGFPRDSQAGGAPGVLRIGLVTRGWGVQSDADGEHRLGPGEGFVLWPGESVGFRIDRRQPYGDWLALCDTETAAALQVLEVVPPQRRWRAVRPERAHAAYRRLASDLDRRPRIDRPQGLLRFAQFLLDLQRVVPGREHQVSEADLARAAELLAEHCTSALRTDAVLAAIAVPYDRLRKAFSAVHGIGPAQYRIRERIARACTLLAQEQSVASVAETLGYADAFQFSKQFRKVMGVPPSRYRPDDNGRS